MQIADQTKLLIGLAFAASGLALILSARRTSGFGQRQQAGALLIVAALVFTAIGLGYIDV